MSPTTENRIVRLEDRLKPGRCAVCRAWDGTTVCDETACLRPERCPSCGFWLPYKTVVVLAGIALEDV